jgi:hypothetical protein
MWLFEFVAYGAALIALFTFVDYFYRTPSLQVGLHQDVTGFALGSIRSFYSDNNFKIPNPLLKDPNTREIFAKEKPKGRQDASGALDSASDYDILQDIKNGRDVNWYLPRRIEWLERQLKKCRYEKQLWMFESAEEYYSEDDAKRLLGHLRPKLTQEEYFSFFVALLHSRYVSNGISMENDGSLDLTNLEIFIVAPLAKTTEQRENTILNYRVESTLPNSVERDPNGLKIKLPILRVGEFFLLAIETRENQIVMNDISYSFDSGRQVDKRIFWKTCLVIFAIMILFAVLLPGRKEGQKP